MAHDLAELLEVGDDGLQAHVQDGGELVVVEALGDGDRDLGGDLPAVLVRRLIGDDAFLGLSAATPDELRLADEQGACDHVGIGTIRDTPTKPDAPAGLGLDGAARLAALTDLPAVAIGGVTVADAPALRAGGLNGIAVVSAICAAEDPRAAAAALHSAWNEGESR